MSLIKRICMWFAIRESERQLDGLNAALYAVTDDTTAFAIWRSIERTEKELSRQRAEYTGTFKPGIRHIWRQA